MEPNFSKIWWCGKFINPWMPIFGLDACFEIHSRAHNMNGVYFVLNMYIELQKCLFPKIRNINLGWAQTSTAGLSIVQQPVAKVCCWKIPGFIEQKNSYIPSYRNQNIYLPGNVIDHNISIFFRPFSSFEPCNLNPCWWLYSIVISKINLLVGGWATPLKNMSSSVGMMTFPLYGKS